MNIVLLYETDLERPGRYVVRDRRALHIRDVLNKKDGDEIRVGLADGPLGTGRVRHVLANEIELDVSVSGWAPMPWFDLVVAIPRPKMLKRIAAMVSAMGMRELHLIRSWRVQRQFLSSPALDERTLTPFFEDGLMQGGWTVVPRLKRWTRFNEWTAHEADAPPEGTRLIAHPGARLDLVDVPPSSVHVPVRLAIGPEGGFLDEEVERAESVGYLAVRSGRSTLRTDAACVAILAQLDMLLRRH
ncbi:MAG: RsmE family RNA methyltransferase [Myxococcales bacterium]|nr:RsmE family RNA methyltransferase [Myxococcales bacterium]